jgi:nitrogen fixation/metabolism regulation signal transduction histidine kinase
MDHEEKVSYANPAAASLFRQQASALAGRSISAIDAPFGSSMAGMENGESAIFTVRGARKVLCRKSSFMDRGHPRTFFVFEELTEELRRLEKGAYEKVIRTLSHEVHNSLGAANSLLHSCLAYAGQIAPADRGDFETALNVAIARTEHLNAFMKSYADIMRLPPPRRTPTDVRALLKSIATLIQQELERRRITLRWEGEFRHETASMDPHQMEQAFLNVMKNAMEAIGTDGVITIRRGEQAGRRFVTIEDSGCGIGEEARGQLFTPFFSTKENGQGIGLTLIREVLSHHNYEFALDSAPGEPTRFTVYVE